MQNISIPDIIANLKGRRGYEEKKAKKLGYDCLEKYFEDKLANEAQLLAENEIKVSANNPEKEEASDDIKAEFNGQPIEVGFNVNYLIDVLNVIKTKKVQILLKDSSSSALLSPENDNSSSYVVMPLRL